MRCVNHNLQHAERIAGNDSKICKICNTKRCGNDRNLHLYSCGHIFYIGLRDRICKLVRIKRCVAVIPWLGSDYVRGNSCVGVQAVRNREKALWKLRFDATKEYLCDTYKIER